MPDIQKLEDIATQVRRDIVRMVHANNSGHPGGSLGCTEFFISLYKRLKRVMTYELIEEEVSYCFLVVHD